MRLEWLSPPIRDAVAYAFRTWVAGCTALGIAFFCQLESPYWAAIATWIAPCPIPGMTVSKSFYRIVGSMLGAFIGVVLIALFAQSPDLFILALASAHGGLHARLEHAAELSQLRLRPHGLHRGDRRAGRR